MIKCGQRCGMDVDWFCLSQDGGPAANSCEHGNEPLRTTKYGEFVD